MRSLSARVQLLVYLGLSLCVWLIGAHAPAPVRGQPGADVPPETDTELEAGTPEYERAVKEGLAAYRSGDFAAARARFERAHAQQPSARTWRALGLTAVEQKRYSQAKQELQAALRDTRRPLTEAQHEELAQMLAWMDAALSRLSVRVEPADARVALDGITGPLPLLAEPGSHRLHVEAAGYVPLDQSVQMESGQERSLQVVLEPAALDPHHVAAAVPPDAAATPGRPPNAAMTSTASQTAATTNTPPNAAMTSTASAARSSPVTQRWWFWTAIGVAVVGGTVLAIALSSGTSPDDPPGVSVEALHAHTRQ